MSNFSQKLNELLSIHNITRYRLAKELNCSKQSVCNWCEGFSEPNLDYLKKIAKYFDVTTDFLLGLED